MNNEPNPSWRPAPFEVATLLPTPTVSRKGKRVIDKRWKSGTAPIQVEARSFWTKQRNYLAQDDHPDWHWQPQGLLKID